MTIETAYEGKTAAQNNSFAILAERAAKTKDCPYGFKQAAECRPDETVVLALPGTNSNDRFRECNGFLKRFDNFIHQTPEFAAEFTDVRCLTAVISLGRYFNKDKALELLKARRTSEKEYAKKLQALPLAEQREFAEPAFINDIYEALVAPRISSQNGTIRRPLAQALRNIRKLNIVTYCFGSYTALKLEEQTLRHMQKLGYSEKEQAQILSQLLVLNYSADIPLGLSQAKSVNIASLSDLGLDHGNYVKELVHFGLTVAAIPPLYLPTKHGGTFYCPAYNKKKIKKRNEPLVVESFDADTWFKNLHTGAKGEQPIREHDFLGFEERPEMSTGARTLQNYGKNILQAGVQNAVNQPQEGYKPLPSTKRLAARTLRQKLELIKFWHGGHIVQRAINKTNKDYLMQNSFAANIRTITID